MEETAPPSRFRRVMNGAALAVLVGTFLWLAYHWSGIPERLPLRMNLNAPPTVGGKGRLIVLPIIMLFLYLLLSYTEKIGVINMPDLGSPERNRAAAREASAGLKFFCVALMASIQLTILASSNAAPPGVVGTFFAFVGGVGVLLFVAGVLRVRVRGEGEG